MHLRALRVGFELRAMFLRLAKTDRMCRGRLAIMNFVSGERRLSLFYFAMDFNDLKLRMLFEYTPPEFPFPIKRF